MDVASLPASRDIASVSTGASRALTSAAARTARIPRKPSPFEGSEEEAAQLPLQSLQRQVSPPELGNVEVAVDEELKT